MKSIYFASDFHFGAPTKAASDQREKRVIHWLESIQDNAEAIYLLGDIFDFWHEYKTVVPKGNIRFLGKLAELSDSGIDIEVFTGNHDLWMSGYFEDELGISVYKEPEERVLKGRSFYIGHGDGLGPADKTYKNLRKLFHHPVSQFLFRWIHPDIGMKLAQFWSANSRSSHSEPEEFLGEESEWLVQYCKTVLETKSIDYFIFGHRHLPLDIRLNDQGSRYINLGEWISQNHYAVFDGNELQLLQFEA